VTCELSARHSVTFLPEVTTEPFDCQRPDRCDPREARHGSTGVHTLSIVICCERVFTSCKRAHFTNGKMKLLSPATGSTWNNQFTSGKSTAFCFLSFQPLCTPVPDPPFFFHHQLRHRLPQNNLSVLRTQKTTLQDSIRHFLFSRGGRVV
jgi:hypothetical protein